MGKIRTMTMTSDCLGLSNVKCEVFCTVPGTLEMHALCMSVLQSHPEPARWSLDSEEWEKEEGKARGGEE